MMLKLSDITTWTLFMVVCLLLSSHGLHVERGDRDIFENPSCLDSDGSWCTCYQLNADCVSGNDCTRCQCKYSFPTFYSSSDKHGRCVRNADLKLIPANSSQSSFLVQNEESKLCIKYDHGSQQYANTDFLVPTVCDENNPTQRWIFTNNGQLLNMDTLNCLRPTDRVTSQQRHLVLEDCRDWSAHQIWSCIGQKFKIWYDMSDHYMWYDNSSTVITMRESYSQRDESGMEWQRLGSGEALCSEVSAGHSCHGFVHHPYLLVVNMNCASASISCEGKERISFQATDQIPHYAKCSIMWDQLQFLDHDEWKSLSYTERIFVVSANWIALSQQSVVQLQWNFTNASSSWSGLVIKLQFKCTWHPWQQEYTGCVMIKFKGAPINPSRTAAKISPTPMIPSGLSTPTDTPSFSKKTDEPTSAYKSPSSILPAGTDMPPSAYHSTKQTPNKANSEQGTKSKSSNVVTIVVCSVVAILISFAILGFIFYKRRFSNSPKSSSGADNQGDSSARQSSADTRNAIYTPAENSYTSLISNNDQLYQEPEAGASQECVLYESSANNTENYATYEKDENHLPAREETYDYAKNDDIRSAVQQMHPKSNSRQDNRNVSSNLEGKKIDDADTTSVYQTLDDPYQNV